MFYSRFLTILGLIALGMISRFIPHPPNFTAIEAIALLSFFFLGSLRSSLLTVFTIMLLSDLVIGFHHSKLFIYFSYGVITLLGYWIHSKKSLTHTTVLLIASSILFFVITNFGVWVTNPLYPKTSAGLYLCYLAALPFFTNQVLGSLAYSALIFGGFLIKKQFFAKEEAALQGWYLQS